MAELQADLADTQQEHSIDATKDALDEMQEAYEEEKDAEIEKLDGSISSTQKLYNMAIDYIQNHWDTLYQELCDWNYEYGTVLTQEISDAWDSCSAAVERYGSYLEAAKALAQEIADITEQINNFDSDSYVSSYLSSHSSEGSGAVGSSSSTGDGEKHYTISNTSATQPTNEERILATVKQMYQNSQAWHGSGGETQDALEASNVDLATSDTLENSLKRLGVNAWIDPETGVWYTDGGVELYAKYQPWKYHTGGYAGGHADLDKDEIPAVLQKGELVLDKPKIDNLFKILSFTEDLTNRFGQMFQGGAPGVIDGIRESFSAMQQELTQGLLTERGASVAFGDVYIYGANEETVEKHKQVTREMVNEMARLLKIKM